MEYLSDKKLIFQLLLFKDRGKKKNTVAKKSQMSCTSTLQFQRIKRPVTGIWRT